METLKTTIDLKATLDDISNQYAENSKEAFSRLCAVVQLLVNEIEKNNTVEQCMGKKKRSKIVGWLLCGIAIGYAMGDPVFQELLADALKGVTEAAKEKKEKNKTVEQCI